MDSAGFGPLDTGAAPVKQFLCIPNFNEFFARLIYPFLHIICTIYITNLSNFL